MSTKKIISSFAGLLLVISIIQAVDLTNYSLSFPTNGNGYLTIGNGNVNKMTFEAWVKLGPNETNSLVASKNNSWEVRIVNDRIQFRVVQEWVYLWRTSYEYGIYNKFYDQ